MVGSISRHASVSKQAFPPKSDKYGNSIWKRGLGIMDVYVCTEYIVTIRYEIEIGIMRETASQRRWWEAVRFWNWLWLVLVLKERVNIRNTYV